MKTEVAITQLRRSLATLQLSGDTQGFHGLPEMEYAFFPGGNGLHGGRSASLPINGVLILGSNFGCVTDFVGDDKKLCRSDERANSTWRPLLARLQGANIPFDKCFFTNAWPFLHLEKGNLGPVKTWLYDRKLMSSCVAFFQESLTVIRPRLIVALGTGPAAFLSHVWPAILCPWRGYAIPHLDELPMAEIEWNTHKAICAAITHPAMPNAWRRREPYKNKHGEMLLLKEAWSKAQLL